MTRSDTGVFGLLSPLAALTGALDMLEYTPSSSMVLQRLIAAEPPYARLLRRLGLYDLPTLPQHAVQQATAKPERVAGSRVMAHVNDALGESARWASMDRIEEHEGVERLFRKPHGFMRSYQSTTRTRADGAVETREVTWQNGRREETVTVRYPPGTGIPDESHKRVTE
ncbi:hypothetical protein DL89DRAFT_319371 [Linderina pennispora]|uniref:Uncharacterized protein n=1 Tax=Linderina pennispora TaxID=61395 RepID=A0A1Y1WKH1_9FUNG|nr:uncharacterized protein DL89DRAFT_319371 [Linderina pennispora]ORX73594.1 hypothetical protein DL89DRAFT_319371 [Linderina pennispora]